MDLFCRFGSHIVQSRAISNDGYEFSRCRRCGCALVRRGSESWQSGPNGYRLVEEYDDLPWQHMIFFEPDEKEGAKNRSTSP